MPKTIAVIDGNSLMHRAYHAIQTPMMSPDGQPTNAVFGFLQMFCKFAETADFDAVICAFDEGKPEHRMQELPQYKAQRPHMDDELRVQFPMIEELLKSMNVPIVKVPGWEGDDILGTIASRDEKLGYNTLLVTGDKDACQLASDLTKIVTTKKGISEVSILGPDEVMEKYGVSPEQFIDYLGLMGDSSDNIPGVPGIGPKTATKLLETYGSIEGIYENIDDLKGKQRENLVQNEDLAYLSRQIATIITDLDFEIDLEAAEFPAFDPQEVQETFGRYALSSPLTRVLKLVGKTAQVSTAEVDFGKLVPESKGEELISSAIDAGSCIGFAFLEVDADTIFGAHTKAAFSTDDGTVVIEGDLATEMLIKILKDGVIAADDLKRVFQLVYPPDTASEALISEEVLYSVNGFDLGIAAYVLLSTVSDYSYGKLAERYLGGSLPETKSQEEALFHEAACARILAPILANDLKSDESYAAYSEIDLPLVPVLAQMERIGVALDVPHIQEVGRVTQDELTHLADEIYKIAGEEFNIDSPKQLSRILFEVMGLTPIKKNRRGYSTDANVMRELAKTEDIASLVLRYRELSKIKSTYIDSLPKMRGEDGRLHTEFHETVTATGRLSSSNPNLQNIPARTEFGRQIRECFVPLSEGQVFLSADYSQIELRLLAHMSEDEGLIEAFLSDADFHAQTAARVFGVSSEEVSSAMRSRAKAVNFGIVYGQQAYGLSQTLDIDYSEAKDMIDKYFEAYPKVRAFLDGVVSSATESGYAESMFGRKRRIPELMSSNRQMRGVGERTAMNHPLQGTAADIIKIAMNDVQRRLNTDKYQAKLLLQVHDELDFTVPLEEVEELSTMVKEVMESVVELKVPLSVDVSYGSNWAEAH